MVCHACCIILKKRYHLACWLSTMVTGTQINSSKQRYKGWLKNAMWNRFFKAEHRCQMLAFWMTESVCSGVNKSPAFDSTGNNVFSLWQGYHSSGAESKRHKCQHTKLFCAKHAERWSSIHMSDGDRSRRLQAQFGVNWKESVGSLSRNLNWWWCLVTFFIFEWR